ncbi:hypothetical protein P9A16_31665 [Shinella sp. 838]|uniref:hypothetical protein n=1 Tax=Shinella sp. 838 TaxID=3038164 RepID=UPI002414F8A1|nr:hypothetical protein [Shinella sp. 838]MDG4675660.1 hypothetical protein [Shinella sp. 838]
MFDDLIPGNTGSAISFDDLIPKKRQAGDSMETGGVGGVLRAASRGVLGIGSYLDELDAATNATLAPIIDPLLPDSFEKLPGQTWDERYNQALEIQRGKDRAFDEENPIGSTVAQIGGGLTSGGALLKAAPVIGNYALGNAGTTLGMRIGAGAAAGGATGALQGFGAGEGGVDNRLDQSLLEGGIGFGLGGLAAPVGDLVGKGINAARSRVANRGSGIGRGAMDVLTRDLAAEGTDLASVAARARELGDDAMLADVSDILRLRAEQIAQSDNPARSGVLGAIRDRGAGAGNRIAGIYDQALGDNPNVQATLEDMFKRRSSEAGPLYKQAMARPVAWDERLQQFLSDPMSKTGLAKGVEIQRLESLAEGLPFNPEDYAITGFNDAGDPIISGVPNFRTLDVIKKGMDALVDDNKNEFGRLTQKGVALSKTRDAFVRKLDDINPDYATARKSWAGGTQEMNAFNEGRDIFSSRIHPDFLSSDFSKMSEGQKEAFQLGVRAAADEAMGRVRNGALKGRQLLDADFNERKILTVLGKDEGRKLINALNAEQAMAETAGQVAGNSASARRLDNPFSKSGRNMDVSQSMYQAGRRLLQREIEGIGASGRERMAAELGPVLTATGDRREQLIRQLIDPASRTGGVKSTDPKLEAMARALLQIGGRAAYPLLPGVRE